MAFGDSYSAIQAANQADKNRAQQQSQFVFSNLLNQLNRNRQFDFQDRAQDDKVQYLKDELQSRMMLPGIAAGYAMERDKMFNDWRDNYLTRQLQWEAQQMGADRAARAAQLDALFRGIEGAAAPARKQVREEAKGERQTPLGRLRAFGLTGFMPSPGGSAAGRFMAYLHDRWSKMKEAEKVAEGDRMIDEQIAAEKLQTIPQVDMRGIGLPGGRPVPYPVSIPGVPVGESTGFNGTPTIPTMNSNLRPGMIVTQGGRRYILDENLQGQPIQ